MRRARQIVASAAAAALLSGCAPLKEWVGIRLLYERAPVPASVIRDLVYVAGSEDPKHRLDLYLPAGNGWPTLIFVHGGGWTAGDKSLTVSKADVYGNIGRFYSSRGIGTAVISYRLQPEVVWRDQVDDVASAVAFVRAEIVGRGGDADALFLAGHSAGAQLSTYAALDPAPLDRLGLEPAVLCGVVPVSGVAYDPADPRTYELGAERPYYEERFGDDEGRMDEASAIRHISAAAPPFLIVHGSREWPALIHQNRLLHDALADAGVPSELIVARQSHESMVLALAHENKIPATAVLRFIRSSNC